MPQRGCGRPPYSRGLVPARQPGRGHDQRDRRGRGRGGGVKGGGRGCGGGPAARAKVLVVGAEGARGADTWAHTTWNSNVSCQSSATNSHVGCCRCVSQTARKDKGRRELVRGGECSPRLPLAADSEREPEKGPQCRIHAALMLAKYGTETRYEHGNQCYTAVVAAGGPVIQKKHDGALRVY